MSSVLANVLKYVVSHIQRCVSTIDAKTSTPWSKVERQVRTRLC